MIKRDKPMQSNTLLQQIQNFKGAYPRQIWGLFFSEMWERFCFYGMRGMLVFFMISQLNFNEKEANLQYGATQAFVYAFTFVGGLFADKILGFRKSLFWGGFLMIIGSLLLAINPHHYFFLGIAFTIVGTGFFKPNISSMVGCLYKKDDTRRDSGFSLFYAGINLGALIGGYICVAIGKGFMFEAQIPEAFRWNVAFGLAAVVMMISLVNFVFTQKSLGPIGLQPTKLSFDNDILVINKWYEVGVYALSILIIPLIVVMVSKTDYTDYFMSVIGPATLVYLFYELRKCTPNERKKIYAALVFILFSILFWAIYEQSGGSLSIFAAKNLDTNLLVFTMDPNGVNNSGGAFFVIFFAPLVGFIWFALSKYKIEPNSVSKFGLGFIFLGIAYMLLFAMRYFANDLGIASLNFFTFALFVITLGEICLSPIGLSLMTKLATEKLQGVMMGMWFLASAYGQYVAGLIGAGLSETRQNTTGIEALLTYTQGYKELAFYAFGAGMLLLIISPWVKKMMLEVR